MDFNTTKTMFELNVVIDNGNQLPEDDELFFGGKPNSILYSEEIHHLPTDIDMADLLLMLELFPSKSQARKNWKGSLEIPPGFSEFKKLGKKGKRLYILNPIKET